MSADFESILDEVMSEDKILLLSIKPEYSAMIFKGEKTIELRRQFPKFPSKYILVYESSPKKRLRGILRIKKCHIKKIKYLQEFLEKAKVNKTFINEYFKGKDIGVAIEVEKLLEFNEPIPLKQLREAVNFVPPQNYRYVKKEEIATLKFPM